MKKWKTPGTLFLLLFMILLMGCGSEETGPQFGSHSHPPEYWPTDDWRSIDPPEVGMDAVELQQVYDYVANPNINAQGFVVEALPLPTCVVAWKISHSPSGTASYGADIARVSCVAPRS